MLYSDVYVEVSCLYIAGLVYAWYIGLLYFVTCMSVDFAFVKIFH